MCCFDGPALFTSSPTPLALIPIQLLSYFVANVFFSVFIVSSFGLLVFFFYYNCKFKFFFLLSPLWSGGFDFDFVGCFFFLRKACYLPCCALLYTLRYFFSYSLFCYHVVSCFFPSDFFFALWYMSFFLSCFIWKYPFSLSLSPQPLNNYCFFFFLYLFHSCSVGVLLGPKDVKCQIYSD